MAQFPEDREQDDNFYSAWAEYEEWSQGVDDRLPPYDQEPYFDGEPRLTDDQPPFNEEDIPF